MKRTTIVLGLGATGYSCVRHLAAEDRVLAVDTRPRPPRLAAVRERHPEVELIGRGGWRQALAQADRMVVSPGIALDHCLVAEARAAGVAITSDIELFLAEARAPVVGITGTNGKSTVTTLVGALYRAGGRCPGVGGNLGPPALDLLAEERDAYVLELSSFQLERLVAAPRLAVACVLNVSADHGDRYAGLDDYAAAKRRIYEGAAGIVCNAADVRTRPAAAAGEVIALGADPGWRLDGDDVVLDGQALAAGELALKGRHNHFNVLAAAAVAHLGGIAVGAVRDALCTFAPLPHRSALLGEIDSVAYVDDSKATNVGACLAALEGFGNGAGNVVLIAGGDGKGASFEPLADAVTRHVSHLVLLGRDAPRLAAALAGCAETSFARDMAEAVRLAAAAAAPGGCVLLSPACASWDMYPGFAARGDAFAAAVRSVARRGAVAGSAPPGPR